MRTRGFVLGFTCALLVPAVSIVARDEVSRVPESLNGADNAYSLSVAAGHRVRALLPGVSGPSSVPDGGELTLNPLWSGGKAGGHILEVDEPDGHLIIEPGEYQITVEAE